jgi:hypothetical protein
LLPPLAIIGGLEGAKVPDTRTEPDHTSWLVPVMVFGIIMALGVGSGAAAMLWATSDDDEPVNTTAANTTQAAETSQPTQPNDEPVVAGAGAPDAAVACRETLAAADAVLGAAREGLSHWGAHVQAEVDYRALRITRDEQKKIFSETGALGPQDIKVFKERDDAYKARGAACGQLDPATVPSADNCVDRNNAVADAVAVGRKAMSDWETHLANMGKFRQGELDPSHAQHLWELAAQQGSANIDAFWTADHALQNAPACNM